MTEKEKNSLDMQVEVITEVDEPKKGSLSQQVEKVRTRQKSYVMDLRIHSPASLGYFGVEGLDTAPALVRLAAVKGLDVIALTDFYTGTYVDRVIYAARDTDLTIIPGCVLRAEIPGCNDVIISCLFSEQTTSMVIDNFLRALDVPAEAAGNRNYIVKRDLRNILEIVEVYGGVAFPSRMDKTPYRMAVIPQLVEEYGFRTFDLAYADTVKYFKSHWPKIKFHLFSFSNANALAQVGSRIARVKMQVPGFEGIKQIITRSVPI